MIQHQVMEPLTAEWLSCIMVVAAVIGLVLVLPQRFSWARSPYYPIVIAILLLMNLIIENGYANHIIAQGSPSKSSLPRGIGGKQTSKGGFPGIRIINGKPLILLVKHLS